MNRALATITAVIASLAVSLWLGGLIALGAITAPIVFSVAPMPQSADAMTQVFQRFDILAMTCAALALAAEAARAILRLPAGRIDHVRTAVVALAAGLATYEGAHLSPQIAGLHAAGAIRGVGVTGIELSRLHDAAEACGKAQVLLLVALVVLQVIIWSQRSERPSP